MSRDRSRIDGPAPVLAPTPGHEGDADAFPDSAYSSIRGIAIWELLSLACFAGSLLSRHISLWLVPHPQPPAIRFFLPIGLVLGLSLLGIGFGWIGRWRSPRKGWARFAIFLNGVVLVLGVLLFLVMMRIFGR